jgi:hypothetical protein
VQGYGQDKIINQTRKLVILTLLTPVNAGKYEGEKKGPFGGYDGHSATPDILRILWKQSTNIHYEENNQQNALIVSLINLIIYNYSNMFRPLS